MESVESMVDLSIVIVNYKMKADIEKCLASLFSDIAESGLPVDVVVVDNASGDGIDAWLKETYPAVRCIMLEENIGFGRAQNLGLQSCDASYYMVLNPDTSLYPGQHTLQRIHAYMEQHPKIGLIGPKILYPDGSLQYSCYRFPTFWQPLFSRTKLGQKGKGRRTQDRTIMKDFDHQRTQPVDWVMGSAMVVRRSAMKEVGMFDERFWMYYEDTDWCRRMWETGWPVYYVHDIMLEHVHGRRSAKVPGILQALLKNKLTRVHIISWLTYMWKWRGNHKYYGPIS